MRAFNSPFLQTPVALYPRSFNLAPVFDPISSYNFSPSAPREVLQFPRLLKACPGFHELHDPQFNAAIGIIIIIVTIQSIVVYSYPSLLPSFHTPISIYLISASSTFFNTTCLPFNPTLGFLLNNPLACNKTPRCRSPKVVASSIVLTPK
ncbi:BQ5605_C012g06840 [Microbotryum silenes-dioicae]|uniref:BQ5605_C012g06840 protein n=1 Tax=Microbotryum silenes-dioicae TaxID=796604 RepID=A0A2X0NV71_9BASI|nr:BQ5605_C012g06840 [Microbotryum silenes-dioicae]